MFLPFIKDKTVLQGAATTIYGCLEDPAKVHKISVLGFRVWVFGIGFNCLGFRVFGFGVQGLGFSGLGSNSG